MEQTTADLGDIAEYFEYQIALGDSFGLPGLGCFVTQLAGVIVIFANGLWSLSRNTTDAAILRGVVASFLKMVREHPK